MTPGIPDADATLRAVSLADTTETTLGRFYRELMERAFRPEELVTLAELDAARSSGDAEGVLLLRGDRPVAGMITEDYLGGAVRLLAYLVVETGLRGRGVGGDLLRRLSAARASGIVLAEIDDPRFHQADERGDPSARVRFYQRAGSRLLPLPYVQPALRPGSARAGNMLLITVGDTSESLDGALVTAFLDEYFGACEGPDVVRTDPAYLALRAAASGGPDGRLPLHPLTALSAARPDQPKMRRAPR